MNHKIRLLFFIGCLFSLTNVQATHIVGAELFYECTDPVNSRYSITLKLYRDCLAGQAPFDEFITVFAFSSKSGQPSRYLDIPIPIRTPEIVPEEWDVCVGRPYNICVQEGIYKAEDVYLPPIEGGYDLAWARCCRNQAITNLESPLSEGVTYLAHVPGPEDAECNTMPQFKQFPPIFLCAGETFNFDHSAVDVDGDSLSYAVTNPFTGINIEGLGAGNPREGGNQPIVDRFDNPMGPPPYQNVVFRSGFGFGSPFGSRRFSIDPLTGFITATPEQEGIYVYSISVFEWRNGKLLSENRRDFQIHVIPCQEQDTPPVITHDLGDLPQDGDTLIVDPEFAFCYDINVTDPNVGDRLTAFEVSAPFGNGFAFRPLANLSFEGTNPLTGEVCWRPSCDYAGQTVPLIIGARDLGDCPSISNVFDTVWVRIQVPPNDAPEVSVDLEGNTFNGDTLFIRAGDDFCFDFSASDINAGDSLSLVLGSSFNQVGGPTVSYEEGNPLQGEVCWETSCELVGQLVPLQLIVVDDAQCPSQKETEKIIYVSIIPPDNDPPTLIADLSGLNSSGDTVFVVANEAFCFPLSAVDINENDSVFVEPLSPIFGSDTTLTLSFAGINPVEGELCWQPNCTFEDAVVPLVLSAFDNGLCGNELRALDTIFVSIEPEEGLAPEVGFDLGGFVAQGDTLSLDIEDSLCLNFFVADLTENTGFDFDVRFETLDGTEVSLGDPSNILVLEDSVTGEICVKPDCSNGGSLFRLIVEGIDNKFCEPVPSDSDTLFIKVNTTLEVVLGADVTFCEGSGGNSLSANIIGTDLDPGEFTYAWNCSNPGRCGLSDINAPNPIANPSRSTTYFLQVTDPDGCTSEIDSIELNVLPQPFIDVNADRSLCVGEDSVSLDVIVLNDDEVPGPLTYSWFPAEGLSDPNSPTPKALPDSTTIYTVIVTGGNGCSSETTNLDESSTTIVELLPPPVANAGPDLNVCEGDSVTLLGSVTGEAEGVNYAWMLGTEIVSDNVQNLTVSPTRSETFVLLVANEGCEGIPDTVVLTYHAQPTLLAASPVDSVCANESVELNVMAFIEGDSTSGYSYAWEANDGLSDLTSPSPTVNLNSSQTLRVSATSDIGCSSAMLEIPITVKATPIAEAGPDAFACGDESIQLQGSFSLSGDGSDSSQVSINWSPGDGLSLRDTLQPELQPEQSTLYFLTVSQGNCSTTDSVLVDLFLGVDASVSADTNRVCAGTEVQLSVAGGNGSPIFTWLPAAPLDESSSANPIATPDTTTTFIVVLEEQGCSASDSIRIDVLPAPIGDLEASSTVICPDASVDFMAIGEVADFVWDFGDGSSSSEMAPSYAFQTPGVYTVSLQGTSPDGCFGVADQIEIEVLEPGLASFLSDPDSGETIIDPELTINFTDQSTGAVSYLWDFGDGNTSDMVSPSYSWEKEGLYEVSLTITDAGGCIDSDTVLFELRRQSTFFPNVFTPNADGVLDQFAVRYTGADPFHMQIFDRWGKLVFETSDPEMRWDGTMTDGKEAEDGVYFYVAEVAEEVFKGHVTLMR